ncbi:undecaprenyl/decaprenyl-phosphate alpha-N-acetylglucosaminyl 1-phosphate transferase [bacterium]|nr:undecaprenyl/decaprenyl-phosphate alpha-N-acetylglucosaminyl 1-phosphate transferase [bacterium]
MNITIGLISFFLSCFFLYFSRRYYLKRNILDIINERSSHKESATGNGGVAIYSSLFIISVYFYLQGIEVFDYSYLIPLSILLVVGLYDDVYDVDFRLKFLFQIITAKILIDNGVIIDNFHGILGLYELNRIFAQIFSVFIIVAIINSINFIDGIDGLAVSVVSTFIILFEYFSLNETEFITISFVLIGSFIPMLYFNFRSKNKIFLGDAGSLFLGGIVSIYVFKILSNDYLIKEQFDINKIIFVISILSYPILDITRVVFLRLYKGKSPFVADKNHIHHLLLNKLKSHKMTTFLIIILSVVFTVLVQIIFN